MRSHQRSQLDSCSSNSPAHTIKPSPNVCSQKGSGTSTYCPAVSAQTFSSLPFSSSSRAQLLQRIENNIVGNANTGVVVFFRVQLITFAVRNNLDTNFWNLAEFPDEIGAVLLLAPVGGHLQIQAEKGIGYEGILFEGVEQSDIRVGNKGHSR